MAGVEKDPKPCAATLPPPVLKVPLGFCSTKVEGWPKPNVLAPLVPNRVVEPGWPKPPALGVGAPNGFLLAASSLGLPPRPLKKPPAAGAPGAAPGAEPNRPPEEGCCCCCCPKTLPPLGC